MSAETFDAAWLALREAVDHRSRAHGLTDELGRWWAERGGTAIVDLGSGTGSNLRYLAPRLPGRQEWTLVDHDAGLLARATGGGGEPERAGPVERGEPVGGGAPVGEAGRGGRVEVAGAGGRPAGGLVMRTVVCDLADVPAHHVAGADLVTASALLDLVSEAWLDGLVSACVAAGCGAMFALSYDGEIAWGPPDAAAPQGGAAWAHPADALVAAAVNAHQRRDKGLGPALGPSAGAVTAQAFRSLGYETRVSPSPWRLGPADAALARALVEGWSAAATEERPDDAGLLDEWCAHRRGVIADGDFGLTVGHVDVLALPRSAAP